MFQEINSNDIYTKLGYTNIYQFTKTERETIENQLSKHPYIHYRYNSAFIYYVSATYDSGIKLQDDEMTICLPDDLILHNEGEEILLNREILEKENNWKTFQNIRNNSAEKVYFTPYDLIESSGSLLQSWGSYFVQVSCSKI
jgi:hypothetical protein